MRSGVQFFRISCYGGTTPRHQERSRSRVTLEQVREQVRELVALRNAGGFSATVAVKMLETGDAAEERAFLAFFAGVADECFVEPVHNFSSSGYFDVETSVHISPEAGSCAICPLPFYRLLIHPDLDVSPCDADSFHTVVLGNLREMTLRDIWQGERLHQLQLAHLEQTFPKGHPCAACRFYTTQVDDISPLSAAVYRQRLAAQGWQA